MIKLKDLATSKNVLVAEQSKGFFMKTTSYDAYHFLATKDKDYREVKLAIDAFIRYAKARPTNTYLVTSTLGANIDIAPMFAFAPMNVVLPRKFADIIGIEENRQYWSG